MKQALWTAATIGVAMLATGCTPNAGTTNSTTTTTTPTVAAETDKCMTCHGDGTALNAKIQNARAGWATSVHAVGMGADLVDSTGKIIGEEHEGADSFYANAGGCQVCHTKEGFNKLITNGYAPGASTSAQLIAADAIQAPSSLTCFTCHKPHTKGNFDLVVPTTKAITLDSGLSFNKPEGQVCAQCHQARLGTATGAESVITALKSTSGLSFRIGAHHGPNAEMLYGKAGAEFAGQTYGNGTHTSLPDANCVTCHMSFPNARFGGSPGLAGHSFRVIAPVHGVDKANATGCNSTTCHPDATTFKGANVVAANSTSTTAIKASGHLKEGRGYFTKTTVAVSAEHYTQMNTLLTALADPTNSYNGLLQSGYKLLPGMSAKSLTFSTHNNLISAMTAVKESTASVDTTAGKWGLAMYNYQFVLEDRSFGVHNSVYAKRLLWDSANALIQMGATTSVNIGTRP